MKVSSFSQTESGAVRVAVTLPPEGSCLCGEMYLPWTCTCCKDVSCMSCWSTRASHRKTCNECGADVCKSCSRRDFWTDDWHQKGCSRIERTSGTCANAPSCGAKGDKEIAWCCTHCLRQVCYACDDEWDDHGHECKECGAEACHKCSKGNDWHRSGCDAEEKAAAFMQRFCEIASCSGP